jgi:DNA-binding NarL/FixJ family response regulator
MTIMLAMPTPPTSRATAPSPRKSAVPESATASRAVSASDGRLTVDEYVYAALRGGASGFLLKDALADDLLGAVRAVAAGDSVTAPSVTRRLIAHFVSTAPAARPDDRLTPLTAREREVLTLIGRGRSNTEIAQDLRLAPGTVRTHIGRIFAKLELRDRVQAVILTYELGLVELGDRGSA